MKIQNVKPMSPNSENKGKLLSIRYIILGQARMLRSLVKKTRGRGASGSSVDQSPIFLGGSAARSTKNTPPHDLSKKQDITNDFK